MLDIKNLYLSREKHVVLKDFSARIKGGETAALIGPNGTGKTTLLHYLSGLLKADSGVVSYNGAPVDLTSQGWKDRVSYVLDDGGVIPLLTVEEQLRLQCALSGLNREESEERINHTLELCALRRFKSYTARELSLGTQKRLGLALGIIRNAEIYLFDEPLNSLDEQGAAVFAGVLRALQSADRICVVATHSVSFIYPLCSTFWSLAQEGYRIYRDKQAFSREHPIEDVEITLPWLG